MQTTKPDIQLALKRLLAAMIAIMATFCACRGELTDTLQVEIHYPVADYRYRPDFRNNAGVTDTLRKALLRGAPLRVDVVSSASPEGNARYNQLLSEKRTATALQLLSSIPEMNMDSLATYSIGADWTGLTSEMEKVTRHRGQRRTEGGATWRHLKDSVYPNLRVSRIMLVTRLPLMLPAEEAAWHPGITAPTPSAAMPIAGLQPAMNRHRRRRPCIPPFSGALRSNLLYDVAAIPNIGVELALAGAWSVGVNTQYAWWGGRRHARYWRAQGWELYGRRYFGRKPLTGWHIGAYAQMLRYDIRLSGTGYLSGHSGATFFQQPTVGGGLEAGYSLRLAEQFNLDFTAGAGYLTGQYQTYSASPGHHSVWESTRHRRYFGPSKAEIALVWMIGKGGER